jgi:hypothetical protein
MVTVLQCSFFGTLIRDGRDKIHSLSYSYIRRIRFKAGLAHVSCLDCGRKIRSGVLGHSEATWWVHKSPAAVHQSPDAYFQTELFVTANRGGGPLSWIINYEN